MKSLEDQLRSAAHAVEVSPMPTASQLIARGSRRRSRRRRTLGATVAVLAVCASFGVYRLVEGKSEPGAIDASQGSTLDQPNGQTPITPPNVIGMMVDKARATLKERGLNVAVNAGDADLAPAVVIAQKPSADEFVAPGFTIGLRTAFPDPPAELECKGSQHPHDRADPDALPTVEGVSRSAAERAVIDLRNRRDTPVFLAQWDRWAYQIVDEEVQVVRTTGYQVVVVASGPDCGPTAPAFFNGVPVTEVKGPVSAFAASLAERQ
jgi:PASTA domain